MLTKSPPANDLKFKAKLKSFIEEFGYKNGVGLVQWSLSGSSIKGFFGNQSGKRFFEYSIDSNGLSYKPMSRYKQDGLSVSIGVTRVDSKKDVCKSATSYSCGLACINNNKQCRIKDQRVRFVSTQLFREALSLGSNSNQQKTVDRIVLEEENKIVNLPVEKVVSIDPSTGKTVFSKVGNKTSVYIPDLTVSKLKGTVVTHNHPNVLGFDKSDPQYKGFSFSEADIELACVADLSEMRAVSAGYRHSMKPPKEGWNQKFFITKVKPAYKKNSQEVYSELITDIVYERIDPKEASVEYYHRTWQRTAIDTGMAYRRTEFNDPRREV